jgi:hypothetical protein
VLFETVTCIHDIHNIIAASHQLRIIAGSDKDYYTLQTHHSPIMSNIQDAGIQMAETLQTAHINHSPSVEHDINPSTAASEKEPVRMEQSPSEDALSDIDEDEVPLSILRPAPRKPQMPPLPDLRFEQSYLSSIKDAKDWKVVTYITMRDQVCIIFEKVRLRERSLICYRSLCLWCRAWRGLLSFRGGDT